MSDFETIIRPFAAPDVTPRQFFNPGQAGVPNVILHIGRSGQGKTVNGSYAARTTIYMTRYHNEKENADWGTQV